MAIFRKVHTEFWKDPKVLEEMTPEDKYFMLYLLTNPNTTQIGIYSISKKTIAFELGYSMESVTSLMDRFINNHEIIKYNEDTRELAIKNWGKYNLNRAGKPMEDCVRSELKQVKDTSLIAYVGKLVKSSNLKALYDTYTIRGTSSGQEEEKEEEQEQEEEEERETSTTLSKKDISLIKNEWNMLGLQNLRSINSNTKRHTMLKARIKEYSLDEVIEAIRSIRESTFLQGQNKRNWTITFDWLVRPNNFIKVLERNYIDKEGSNNGSSRNGHKKETPSFTKEDAERAGITRL